MTDLASVQRVEEVAEALYALLPAYVRLEDQNQGAALEALFQVLAQGSAALDEVLDAFHDALFVETASPAALEALAGLVGLEPVADVPAEANWTARALIANAIRYRRGKGTSRVLAELAADVTGEAATATEYFSRLVCLAHLSDLRPERPGLAPVRDAMLRQRVGTGRDTTQRLMDMRSISRAAGRHHLSAVGVHLLRPQAHAYAAPDTSALDHPTEARIPMSQLAGVPVMRSWADQPGHFQLAAQDGEAVRLFNPGRSDPASAGLPQAAPDRLSRLALHRETEALRLARARGTAPEVEGPLWLSGPDAVLAIYVRKDDETTFRRLDPSEILICNLENTTPAAARRPNRTKRVNWLAGGASAAVEQSVAVPIAAAFDPVIGRLILAKPSASGAPIGDVRIAYAYGRGMAIGAGAHERNGPYVPFELIDTPDRTHFLRIVDWASQASGLSNARWRTVSTLRQALQDWRDHGAGHVGVIVLTRCDVEPGATTFRVLAHPGSELHIVSGQWRTPKPVPGKDPDPNRLGYLVRRARSAVIRTNVLVEKPNSTDAKASRLVLDGLEFRKGINTAHDPVEDLHIRHCTIRSDTDALKAWHGQNGTRIRLDHVICGRIRIDGPSDPTKAASGTLEISNSIISTDGHTAQAIEAQIMDATLDNVTALGRTRVKSVTATNTIFSDRLSVARSQVGCLRYSYVPPAAGGQYHPKRFRCQPDLALEVETSLPWYVVLKMLAPRFLDTALNEPTVALLHPAAHAGLRTGGEGGTEMGAFAAMGTPIRRANLVTFFDDFLPVGADGAILDDTVSTHTSQQRDIP